MIKNVFYGLTIVICGAAAFFGSNLKNSLEKEIEATSELAGDNKRLSDNIEARDIAIKESKEARKVAVTAKNEGEAGLENESSKEKGLKSELGKLEVEIEGYDEELEKINTGIATAQSIVRELVPDAGGDLGVDAVIGHIEDLENQRQEKETELEDKTVIASKLEASVNAASSRKTNLSERLSRTKQRIALNKVTASVTGVSNDYGFAIISRGSNNSNINDLSKLLVSRDGKFIARLKVAQVEPTQTVCDIVPGSLKPGQRIRNGDRVIVEVPVAN